jgi:acyl dehydratase
MVRASIGCWIGSSDGGDRASSFSKESGFDMGSRPSRSRTPLYLEDIVVGQRFITESWTVEAEAIKAFAREFDPQSFHLDEAAAAGTLFGGLAASGWHTAAITMRLQVESGPPLAGGMIGAGGEVSWPQATRPGDVLHVESEVLAVTPSRSKPDRGMITLRSETRNQRGDVVQSLVAKLVVPKRS